MFPVPAGSHPDFAAVEVLTFILGETPSGRRHKGLVETKKASSAYSYAFQFHDPSVMVASANLRTEQSVDEARGLMLSILQNATTQAPTPDEVKRARDSRLKDWETIMRNSERAALQLSEWTAAGDWRLMFVHRHRLQRVPQAYLKPENRTVGTYLPTKEAQRAPVPESPDVATLVKDYKGREAMA